MININIFREDSQIKANSSDSGIISSHTILNKIREQTVLRCLELILYLRIKENITCFQLATTMIRISCLMKAIHKSRALYDIIINKGERSRIDAEKFRELYLLQIIKKLTFITIWVMKYLRTKAIMYSKEAKDIINLKRIQRFKGVTQIRDKKTQQTSKMIIQKV